MKVTIYIILEPGGDRPYFCHALPTEYAAKPGSKVFMAEIELPGFEKVDGRIEATGVELVQDMMFVCPECGSNAYGSSKIFGTELWQRNCHGYTKRTGTPCTFSFNSTDDAKYFKPLGTYYPRTSVGTTVTKGHDHDHCCDHD